MTTNALTFAILPLFVTQFHNKDNSTCNTNVLDELLEYKPIAPKICDRCALLYTTYCLYATII